MVDLIADSELCALWLIGNLSAVPECYDPDGVFSNAIKEPIGLDVDLAVWKLRKLEDHRTRLGES
jgi:hypothetical protein